jgi:hypothetical protein
MTTVPLQGVTNPTQGPAPYDYRNPTLLPNTDIAVANANGVSGGVALMDPTTFDQANPRVDSTATVTIGGSTTTNDTVTLTVTNGQFTNSAFGGAGSISHIYTVQGGDSVTNVAEQLADLFNADANAQAARLWCSVVGAVITFHHAGQIGLFSTITSALSGGATETVTLGNGGVLAGGSGPVIPFNDFQYSYAGGPLMNFRAGQPYFADYPLVQKLVSDGASVV